MKTIEMNTARVAEVTIGLGVEPDDGCALCRQRLEACPTHMGEAIALALGKAGLLRDVATPSVCPSCGAIRAEEPHSSRCGWTRRDEDADHA